MAQREMKGPGTQPTAAADLEHAPSRKSTEEEQEHRDAGGLDDIPDGDGPRSDRGNNPLPESYWTGYRGDKS